MDLSDQMLDDDNPADTVLASLSSQYFGEWSEVECTSVVYVTNEESNLDTGIVRCAELTVSGGQRIFLDPMWTSGIRIGSAGAAEAWMKEYENGPWTMEYHTWNPDAMKG